MATEMSKEDFLRLAGELTCEETRAYLAEQLKENNGPFAPKAREALLRDLLMKKDAGVSLSEVPTYRGAARQESFTLRDPHQPELSEVAHGGWSNISTRA